MASVCRSAALSAVRSAAFRCGSALPKPSSSRRTALFVTRSVACATIGCTESLMPLHSAIASARLRSAIPMDSSRWSWLCQGLSSPL